MVKFGVPSSDEDSDDEIDTRLDESKHSEKSDQEDELKQTQEDYELDAAPQEELSHGKLRLMNYTLFPQETDVLDFDEESEKEFEPEDSKLAPVQPMMEEPVYMLEPEPTTILPHRYQYQPRGFDLAIPASSIQDRKRTCSFPFRVGWGPRGQFVHTVARTVIAINKIQIRPPTPQTTPEQARQQIISRLTSHLYTPPPPRDRAPVAGEVCQACWKPVAEPIQCSQCPVIVHRECANRASSVEGKHQESFVCSHHACSKCETTEDLYVCEVCPVAYCDAHLPAFAIRRERDTILCSNECDKKARLSNYNFVNGHLAALCDKYDNESHFPHPALGGVELSPNRSVWELVKRLWYREFGGDTWYEDVYARRASLSKWLEDTIRADVEQEAKRCKTDAEIILTFLAAHNLPRACKHAYSGKDFRLGTLLAQAGEGSTLREDIKNQTDNWKKTGTWNLFSETFQNIYLLLGGGVYEEGLRPWAQLFCRRLSWLQCVGLQLWFGETPQNASIEHIFGQYQAAVERGEASGPSRETKLRTVWKRHECKDQVEEVRAGILKYYCNTLKIASKQLLLSGGKSSFGGSLADVLRPESWVSDPLDYSLAWHLHDVLQFTPAYSLDEFPRLENLYMSFIWQLEMMGEWEWAIYVALHSPAGNKSWEANEEVAREILMRNAPLFPDAVLPEVTVVQSPYEALLEQTGPSEQLLEALVQGQALQQQPHLAACQASWWHEAQAVRARYEGLPSAEFSHLLECVSTEDRHQAEGWFSRAKTVAELKLRPLYMLTTDPRESLFELDNRLASHADDFSQHVMDEPEIKVPASEPKQTSARTLYTLTHEGTVPLAREITVELANFQSMYDF